MYLQRVELEKVVGYMREGEERGEVKYITTERELVPHDYYPWWLSPHVPFSSLF